MHVCLHVWLQEVVIESLCYFNSRVQAERFDDIVQYLRSTVPPPLPHRRDLSPSSLQQIFTSCVFLCNFEAYRDLHTEVLMARRDSVSAPSSAPETIRGAAPPSSFPAAPYTPLETKGTDCAAYASLRFLLQETLRRFEAVSGAPSLHSVDSSLTDTGSFGADPSPTSPDDSGASPDSLVRGLVHSMVDGAVDHVELAKTTQRALDCIKRSNAYSYESFWKVRTHTGLHLKPRMQGPLLDHIQKNCPLEACPYTHLNPAHPFALPSVCCRRSCRYRRCWRTAPWRSTRSWSSQRSASWRASSRGSSARAAW